MYSICTDNAEHKSKPLSDVCDGTKLKFKHVVDTYLLLTGDV